MSKTFYGKYRGVVTSISDPLTMGRIQARVPDVLGNDQSGWALPSVPFAGDGIGFYALPSVGARVWIEFEQGDPDYPIWSGCWWGPGELPNEAQQNADKKLVIHSSGGHVIVLDDSSAGEITIQTSSGQKVVMNSTSITIDNGTNATIELSGPRVAVNNDGLEVM